MKDLGFTSGGLYVVKTMVFFDEFNSSLGISMTIVSILHNNTKIFRCPLPHLTQMDCLWYQNIKILTINNGVLQTISFLNRVQRLILSKALVASRKHVYTGLF